MNKFDWDSFPMYTIKCGKLETPYDICKIFANFKISKYVYCISYKGMMVIKYGMSCPKGGPLGERIYRQIGHAYSWGYNRIDGSSGADWLIIERDFEHKHGIKLGHKDLVITVWDVSNYDFKTFNPFKEVELMESEKIDDHIKLFGYKPIGNINDEANKKTRTYVTKNQFNNLFVELDPS